MARSRARLMTDLRFRSLLALTLLAACQAPVKDTTPARLDETPEVEREALHEPVVVRSSVDPCEELADQLRELREAYRDMDLVELEAREARELARHEAAKADADAAREEARRRTESYALAQDHQRRQAAIQQAEADEFRQAVLKSSGIGLEGSLEPKEAMHGRTWEAFTVIEEPPTLLYYVVHDDDPNSKDRNRLALQETMFTEYPKYRERTKGTREALQAAGDALEQSFAEKREADVAASDALTVVEETREHWIMRRRQHENALAVGQTIVELERALDRCNGQAGLGNRIARAAARVRGFEARLDGQEEELVRAREDVHTIAPEGYRAGTHKHLNRAANVLVNAREGISGAEELLDQARHAFASGQVEEARTLLRTLDRTCTSVEEHISGVGVHFGRARFAAHEGQALYFEDDAELRERNGSLSRMNRDHRILESLRAALSAEFIDEAWATAELWSKLPEWLNEHRAAGTVELDNETEVLLYEFRTALERAFRPCETHGAGSSSVTSLMHAEEARDLSQALVILAEGCSLLQRIDALLD